MKRLITAVAVVVLLIVATPGASAAAGGAISKVGWWTRSPAAQAPDGGFNVGRAPDGAVSVAAIEITSSTGLTRAVLTLTEEGGIQADSAKLAVCVTPNDWDSGAAQPMEAAPKPECDNGEEELTRDASSSKWSADVTNLVGDLEDEGAVSLMVVPAGDAAVPVGFEVRFQKPELSSEAAASSSSDFSSSADFPSSSGDTSSSSEVSSSSGSGFSSTGNSGSGSSTFAPSAFDASASAAPVAPNTADGAAGAPVDAPAASAGAGTTATTAPAELAAIPTQAALGGGAVGGGNHALQAIFFVAIATIAGAGAGAGRWYLRSRNPDTNAFA